jgi:hypothetical protein
MQDDFEKWMESPEGQQAQPMQGVDPMTGAPIMLPPASPLIVRPWLKYDVHFNERVKWLNTDKMRDAMLMNPMIEQVVMAHLDELQMSMAPPMPVDENGQPVSDGGLAMSNSNQNSGSTGSQPSGTQQNGPNMGPA